MGQSILVDVVRVTVNRKLFIFNLTLVFTCDCIFIPIDGPIDEEGGGYMRSYFIRSPGSPPVNFLYQSPFKAEP
jgi:hypothetical protein